MVTLNVSYKVNKSRGFTLLELLIVVAILAIIVILTLVAINPAKQTRETRNNKRAGDVLVILSAIDQFKQQNKEYPPNTPKSGEDAKTIGSGQKQSDICSDLVPDIIPNLPIDPSTGLDNTGCGNYDTHYAIERSADGQSITISAPESLDDGVDSVIKASR